MSDGMIVAMYPNQLHSNAKALLKVRILLCTHVGLKLAGEIQDRGSCLDNALFDAKT